MHRPVTGILSILFLSVLSSGQTAAHLEPFFATHAVYVYNRGAATSPDRGSVVTVRQVGKETPDTELTVRTKETTLRASVRFGLNAQVLWSEDSKAFAITGSAEGANGQYQTDVFYVDSDRLRRLPLTFLLENAFGHPVRCGWPESPNVLAVRWMESSKKLLLATQIIHHSNCDSDGTFAGFAVDLKEQRVVRRYDQLAMKRNFATDLGPWLRDSNDSCTQRPPSCYIPANHPELKVH